MHAQGVGERVVATDRNEHVDLLALQHPERMGREIERAVTVGLILEKLRHFLGPHVGRVGPRGVQEGATGPVDRANPGYVERLEVLVPCLRVIRVGVKQSPPAVLDADHGVTFVHDPVDNRLDAGVETGNVSPACENADSHRQTEAAS